MKKQTVKFINQKIYTDVRSWMVYEINEKAGTATAIEVEKKQNQGEPVPKYGAEPFEITRNKNGIWGVQIFKVAFSAHVNALDPNYVAAYMSKPGVEVIGDWFTIYELTPTGKKKQTFEKLGKLSDVCAYFYDYSF